MDDDFPADDLPVDLAKFGRRVRKTREAQGLSLRNLAVRVGMSNPALSQAERGIKLSPRTTTPYVVGWAMRDQLECPPVGHQQVPIH